MGHERDEEMKSGACEEEDVEYNEDDEDLVDHRVGS